MGIQKKKKGNVIKILESKFLIELLSKQPLSQMPHVVVWIDFFFFFLRFRRV